MNPTSRPVVQGVYRLKWRCPACHAVNFTGAGRAGCGCGHRVWVEIEVAQPHGHGHTRVARRDAARRVAVAAKTPGRCWFCGCPLGPDWTIDHLTPVSRGGADEVSNLVPSCRTCNARKGARTLLEYRQMRGHAFRFWGERAMLDEGSAPE